MATELNPRLQELNNDEKLTRQQRVMYRVALGVSALATGVAAFFIIDGLVKTAEGVGEHRFDGQGATELGVFMPVSLGTLALTRLAFLRTREATQSLRRIEEEKTAREQNGPESYPAWLLVADDRGHSIHLSTLVVPTEGSEPSNLPPARGPVIDGEVEGPPPPVNPNQE